MGDPYQEKISAEINQAFSEHDWAGALRLIDLWCGLYPKHAQGWYWRAGCLMYLGHLDRAREAVQRAYDLNPADANTRRLKAGLEKQCAERDVHGQGEPHPLAEVAGIDDEAQTRQAHEAQPESEPEVETESASESPERSESLPAAAPTSV